MGWLEEQFSEQDATTNKLKAIHRKTADKYHTTLPQPNEGKICLFKWHTYSIYKDE